MRIVSARSIVLLTGQNIVIRYSYVMSSQAPATTAHPSNEDEESDANSCVTATVTATATLITATLIPLPSPKQISSLII